MDSGTHDNDQPSPRFRTFSRRAFVGAGAATVAAAAAGTRMVGGSPSAARAASAAAPYTGPFGGAPMLPPERIGIQLYSVRDQVTSPGPGFAQVFQTLAAIGYTKVEFAGYTQGSMPEITVPQIRQLMDANGLTGIGSHISLTPTSDAQMQQALDDAQVLGLPQIGVSFVVPSNTTVSGWQATADTMNHFGQLAAARGIGFYLHNHFQEWSQCSDNPLMRGEDVLLARCDPRYVFFELDIYWAYVGQSQFGQAGLTFDPLLDYALPHRERYRLWHVKDGKPNQAGVYPDPLDDMCDAGEGIIDFEHFFCTVGQLDTHYFIWERDNASSHPQGSLVAAKWSYGYMRHGLVACGSPTAVDVLGFTAEVKRGRVTLSWETGSEADLVGFDVWRTVDGRSRRLTSAPIPAKQAGQDRGAGYRLVDRGVRPGRSYTYRLQLVNRHGRRSWAGLTTAVTR